MKKILFFIFPFLLFYNMSVFAQIGSLNMIVDTISKDNKEIRTFLEKNIRYPIKYQQKSKEGLVTVRFEVTHKGKLERVKIVKGSYRGMNKEVLRAVSKVPLWPIIEKRDFLSPISFTYELTILFKINGPSVTTDTSEYDIIIIGYGTDKKKVFMVGPKPLE